MYYNTKFIHHSKLNHQSLFIHGKKREKKGKKSIYVENTKERDHQGVEKFSLKRKWYIECFLFEMEFLIFWWKLIEKIEENRQSQGKTKKNWKSVENLNMEKKFNSIAVCWLMHSACLIGWLDFIFIFSVLFLFFFLFYVFVVVISLLFLLLKF